MSKEKTVGELAREMRDEIQLNMVGVDSGPYAPEIISGAQTTKNVLHILNAFGELREENHRLVDALKEIRFEAGCQDCRPIKGEMKRGEGYNYIYQVAWKALNRGRIFGVNAR